MRFEEDSPMLLQEKKPGPTRMCGALVVLAAVAVACCLATYNHAEMGWGLLNPGHAEEAAAVPCTNALGAIGLYVAGLLYWAFGCCAYYLDFLALLLGICILVHPRRSVAGQLLSMVVMLILACAIMSVQTLVLQEWAAVHPSGEVGGMLGYLDGTLIAGRLMPEHAALALLIALHGVAVVYAARLGFRDVFHQVGEDAKGFCLWLGQRWRIHRERAAERRVLRRQRAEERARRQAAEKARRAILQGRDDDEQAPNLPARQTSGVPAARPAEDDYDDLPASIEEQIRSHNQRKSGDATQLAPSSRTIRRAGERRGDMHPELPNLLDLNPQPEESAPAGGIAATLRAKVAQRVKPKEPKPRPQPKPAPRVEESDYPFPPLDMLDYKPVPPEVLEEARQETQEYQQRIIDTFATFRIEVEPGPITRGPSITRYEFYPPRGLRVQQFGKLDKDLMLATSSASVNILAPVPGKNTIGIELENRRKSPVYLRELLESPAFNNPKLRIPVALGKDVYGNTVIGDLAAMPHTLVAGTTGSGKSVCINSMILSMLYKFRPDELRLVLVDPKVVEMQPYRKLPHLACPVVTNPARVIGALRWAVNEMEHRYRLFSRIGVRNFEDFNSRDISNDPTRAEEEDSRQEDPEEARKLGEELADEILASNESPGGEIDEQQELELFDEESEPIPSKLPYIVIIIDELADLMQVVKEDLEAYIARLTQKARAAGIHLVAATQTPRANVVTGLIKANIPSRIAFRVASNLDSRVILDTPGAENLLGQGDCLFLPPGGITKLTRAQGAFVSDAEIANIIAFCASHAKQNFDQAVSAEMNNAENSAASDGPGRFGNVGAGPAGDSEDELYARCVTLVVTERKASTSMLQRRFSIGYGRAAKIMDLMEERGVISPPQGATRAREVLIEGPQ